GLAKISTALAILAAIIFFLRVINKRCFNNKNIFLKSINKFLRKYHKFIGIILVFTGLIHGIFSSYDVLSLNMGTICWVLSLLLGLNFMFKKKCKHKAWIYYHRLLTIAFILTLIIHILLVKGFFNISSTNNNITNSNSISSDSVNTDRDTTIIENTDDNDETITESTNSSVENITTTDVGADPSDAYSDGTYEGSGTGYRPGTEVQVTVSNGEIDSIDLISTNDDDKFFNRAWSTIIDEIINSQSTDVDTVSGATRSSNGIIEAVSDAIN
ncbi:MAG: FMN-binding protein, partial [Clostridiaceae bacterium]